MVDEIPIMEQDVKRVAKPVVPNAFSHDGFRGHGFREMVLRRIASPVFASGLAPGWVRLWTALSGLMLIWE